jgi:hypothetical protein
MTQHNGPSQAPPRSPQREDRGLVHPTITDDERRRLRLFNEKANDLEGYGFVKTLYDQETGVMMSGDARGMEVVMIGPDDEALDAFLLTARLFYQDRDRISIETLAEIYGREGITQDLSDEFERVRKALNERLDSHPAIRFEIHGVSITRRRIFEVFLYGWRGHVNPDKQRVYEEWREGPFFPFMSNEFVVTVGEYFNCVRAVRDINRRLLEATAGSKRVAA